MNQTIIARVPHPQVVTNGRVAHQGSSCANTVEVPPQDARRREATHGLCIDDDPLGVALLPDFLNGHGLPDSHRDGAPRVSPWHARTPRRHPAGCHAPGLSATTSAGIPREPESTTSDHPHHRVDHPSVVPRQARGDLTLRQKPADPGDPLDAWEVLDTPGPPQTGGAMTEPRTRWHCRP